MDSILIAIVVITTIVILLTLTAIITRRLHDIGKSGWWQLISFIPKIGPILLFVLLVLPSGEPFRPKVEENDNENGYDEY